MYHRELNAWHDNSVWRTTGAGVFRLVLMWVLVQVCYAFFLMLGTVGYRASLMFVRHIYRCGAELTASQLPCLALLAISFEPFQALCRLLLFITAGEHKGSRLRETFTICAPAQCMYERHGDSMQGCMAAPA